MEGLQVAAYRPGHQPSPERPPPHFTLAAYVPPAVQFVTDDALVALAVELNTQILITRTPVVHHNRPAVQITYAVHAPWGQVVGEPGHAKTSVFIEVAGVPMNISFFCAPHPDGVVSWRGTLQERLATKNEAKYAFVGMV